ncbi:hypothetical protein Mal35_20030 [Gimesia maris]|nr:hypothetical protein Mal35_20030 [Gimesia maris]
MNQQTGIGDAVDVLAGDFQVVNRLRSSADFDRCDTDRSANRRTQAFARLLFFRMHEILAVFAPDRMTGGHADRLGFPFHIDIQDVVRNVFKCGDDHRPVTRIDGRTVRYREHFRRPHHMQFRHIELNDCPRLRVVSINPA